MKGALRLGFVERADLARILRVGEAQLIKACAVDNRDISNVARKIVQSGQAAIAKAKAPAAKSV